MRKYFGKYRAIVDNNVDPMGEQRLLVRLPLDGIAQWAAACLPPIPVALLVMPEVGSMVWVEFEDGDANHPVWTGVTWDPNLNTETSLVSAEPVRVSAPSVTVSALAVRVDAGMVESSGVLKCDTLIANSVVASSYTPGVGNQA